MAKQYNNGANLGAGDKLPGHKIGRRRRFRKDAIHAWVTRGLENCPAVPHKDRE